jgi:hypothetical protein
VELLELGDTSRPTAPVVALAPAAAGTPGKAAAARALKPVLPSFGAPSFWQSGEFSPPVKSLKPERTVAPTEFHGR